MQVSSIIHVTALFGMVGGVSHHGSKMEDGVNRRRMNDIRIERKKEDEEEEEEAKIYP